MAEFKLGRIRFVWKNDWTTSTVYYQDDVVAFGGKMYICVQGHTSRADFFLDFDIVPPKWNLVSDGQTWKGDWTPNTSYVFDDIVKYGARLYIANTIHTSTADVDASLEADIANWDAFAEGLDWKGDWTTDTRYRVNDFIKYGGTTYVCNELHTSAATSELGLEEDQDKWDYFNQGIEYKGEWTSGVRYKVNDLARYGAGVWISTAAHTASSDFGTDGANWTKFVEGFQYENDWSPFVKYQPGDVVRYGGNQYIAKTNHIELLPPDNEDDWSIFTEGFRFLGDWNEDSALQEYKVGEVVRLGGFTYVCIQDHEGEQPPNVIYWKQINSGFRWRDQWLDDQEYYEGDVVRYGDNSYVCVLGHISDGDDNSTLSTGAAGSRPDLANSSQYWSIIAVGSEQSVLTDIGDLVYFTGSGPARLPIGENGQVLRVNANNLPNWEFLNSNEDVYFVAENGVDGEYPIYGGSVDRPFKTIRYACDQIERGIKNQRAQFMLDSNRVFIQKEITAWIRDQIATAAPGSIWEDFEYDTLKCERDVGIVIDKILHDLGHGGNLKTRAAAQTFLNALADGPFSTAAENNGTGPYGDLASERVQSVAAYNRMLELIEAVLLNEAPDEIYQNVTDDSVAIVEQYFNSNLRIEQGAFARISELANIIITAISTGNVNSIPAREVSFSLVKVSTGKHFETLPIIVPAYTCIQGDELRSTQIFAQGSTIPVTDSEYTIATFDRIADVVADVVRGVTVTPTSGNNEIQSAEWPLAIQAESDAVYDLVKVMQYRSDWLLDTMHSAYLTDPTPYNSSLLNARQNIRANTNFAIEEVIAYLAEEYPALLYGKTKTRRDTRYIIDALIYDLTYGGNAQSVTAGLAYWDGDDDTQPQIPASIKTATINALDFLKTTLQSIAGNTTIVSPKQTLVTQTLTGNVGSITQIANNIEAIIAIINTGPSVVGTTVTLVDPTPANGVNSTTALINAYNNLQTYINPATGPRDSSFTVGTGFDNITQAVTIQSDGKILVGGFFNNYDSVAARGIIRLNANGTRDNSFSMGTGFNSGAAAYSIVQQPDGKILVGGLFTNYNGTTQNRITRLNADGTRDTSFSIGTGFDNTVNKIVLQPDGKILVVGAFASYNGTTQNQITRLNADGSRDTSFNIGTGFNAGAGIQAYGAVLQPDGKIIVVGSFTTYNGASASRTARLNTDGSLDTSFSVGSGASSFVLDVALQSDGKIVIVGGFTAIGVTTQNRITRLNADGSRDTSFNIGTGFNGQANEVVLQSDGKILVGGAFSTYNGVSRDRLARLNTDGSLDTGTSFAELGADVDDIVLQSDGKILIVGSFTNYNGPINRIARIINTNGIAANTIAYINSNYPDLVYDSAKCARDIRIILKSIGYDFMFNSNWQTLKAAHAYLRLTASEVYTLNQKAITREAIDYALKTLAVAEVNADTTAIARVNASADTIDQIIFSATNEGSVCQTEDQNREYARLQLERNRNFIVAEVAAYVAQTYSGYTYNEDLCLRDVGLYIDALKYDLKYPGNYKSRYVARYYANAVRGSREEDMFYLRDATGLRNASFLGLNGDLTPPNEFGTSRVTAGAYASLDPGWGPDDFTTWIITRSPYVQGLTTFGNAAIGQKIDGALHNGGNDSIVSNDFTQVISDGIGAWIINNGRAELVSVFTYYSHIGYLAETGGRIRATNGNNSYGDFGSVAEGVDPEEIPVTAIVDNKNQYSATISNVFTDNNQLLGFEYNHAGNDYTEAQINIFGPGDGEIVVADEFRDNAVINVKVDPAAIPTPPAVQDPLGGSGYVRVSNVAQSGTTTSIFLSATDGALSTAYPGMKVYIIGGAGIGNYGIISTYDAGSKEAEVVRESNGAAGWDHVIPGTTIVAPNSSSTYLIEPRIEFSAPPKTTTARTIGSGAYINAHYFETSAQYSNTATTGGSGTGLTYNVTRNGERYYLTTSAAGINYVRGDTITIAGTSVGGASPANNITVTVTTVNSVTGAVVDFDFTGVAQKGLFLALPAAGTGGQKSVDGIAWSAEALPSPGSGTYNNIASGLINDGSSTFKQSVAVAVCAGSSVAAYSTDGDLWSTSTLPVNLNSASATDVAFGQISNTVGRFIVVSEADRDVAYSDNGGATWTLTTDALPTVGYNTIAYGKGFFVAIRTGTTNNAYSTNGVTWTEGSGLPNKTWRDITWGNGRFVALASDGTCSYSLDGITWSTAVTIAGSTTTNRIAYGQGVFVATTTTTALYHSEDGVVWTAVTSLPNTGYTAVAFGNPARTGKFVLIGSGTTTAALDARIGARARGRASVSNEQIFEVRLVEPGSGYTGSAPTITVTDPNNITDVVLVSRLGSGALANPTFVNRGTGFITASAEIDSQNSNGSADFIQDGTFIAVKRLSQRPVPGSNIVFDDLPGQFFKLVNTISFLGLNPGAFTGFLQVSPPIPVGTRLTDGADVELRIRFSQVRLTGHDFLDIGTGGFDTTNYPNTPLQQPDQDNETVESNGGRVFFTATDQDGNFRVGSLFSIEQSTGVATLNADAFNIAGLQELSLGEVTLGGNSASITEFSTDPFFTANSDNIVPTQRAVKAYIEAQIGGGGASLNVNSVTAGDIFIGANTITTVSGAPINIKGNVVFSGTVLGLPLAYNYFLR